MYKDKNGEYIFINQIVQLEKGIWFIESFNHEMNNFVQLRNGCCHTCATPEMLIRIDYTKDVVK